MEERETPEQTLLLEKQVQGPRARRPSLASSVLAGAGVLGLGLAAVVATQSSTDVAPVRIHEHVEVPVPTAVPTPVAEAKTAGPAPKNAEFVFVASAGKRRFALIDRIDAGREPYEASEPGLIEDAVLLGDRDFPDGAVRKVGLYQLPDEVGAWAGKTVRVASQCETQVGDVVEVALLTGHPSYAGVEATGEGELLDYVFGYGARYFAVELSECEQGTWAQLATAPLAIKPHQMKAPAALVARAKRDIIRSKAGREASARWREMYADSNWYDAKRSPWLEPYYVRHPRTGQSWLVVQALADYGCGGAEIRLLGVFKTDGKSLERVFVDQPSAVSTTSLVDIDADGRFELIGQSYVTGRVLTSDQDVEQRRMDLPFFGCPC